MSRNRTTSLHTADPRAIRIHGAREHNLKNIHLALPRGKFVVITGVSGSGKSTLAFDLLFAEGQRRFLDSMNAYARQFVEQMSRPDVDLIAGIPPTVSIEQRISRGGGKSTVATVTETFQFLRLLFARLGTPYCPDCGVAVRTQTRDHLRKGLEKESRKRGDLLLLAPVIRNRKGFHSEIAHWAYRHGYEEIRADGKIYRTDQLFRLDRFTEHDVEIVTGILEKSGSKKRSRKRNQGTTPQQLVDDTLRIGKGTLFALDNLGHQSIHSTERTCPQCGRSLPELDPKFFSYNSPKGWCETCRGFGELFYLPDVDRGARAEAIEESWFEWQEGQREVCPDCDGSRLNPIARMVRLESPSFAKKKRRAALTIEALGWMSVDEANDYFQKVTLSGREEPIARDILPEIRERLKFLSLVGLGYLQLGRGVTTLSGGEAQRIRLAAQLGSNLSGVLYILDEPTIGLHSRDNHQLLDALAALQARGNSLLVVEHDEDTMRAADHIVDLGPGAGIHGGEVVAQGTLQELLQHPESLTGQCLRAKKQFPSRGERRPVKLPSPGRATRGRPSKTPFTPHLLLSDAAVNNLKNLAVQIPLNRLVLVTGVSGSGKSTLVRNCLLPVLEKQLKSNNPRNRPMPGGPALQGSQEIRNVYEVDQSPIGRTPRSIPATYVGFFDDIRRLFAQVPEAKLRGYTASRFSFNSKEGRCPECDGAGNIKLEMNFLPPAFVKCESCQGTRFNRETLDIQFSGKNISEVLELSVDEALDFFCAFQKIKRPLEALRDTGLDYIKLGQTSPTLSGGEAQRVKLVTHLLSGLKEPKTSPHNHSPKGNLFILEEPTIGLHTSDVQRLVKVLHRLIDAGHSVLVIEHNLDLIADADWIIDLGPEGGDAGGRVVATGTPEQIRCIQRSHTGRFLDTFLPSS